MRITKWRMLVVLALTIFCGWFWSGVYTLKTGQQAVLLTFGAANGVIEQPGLHWHWPIPVGSAEIVATSRVRQITTD